MPSLATLITRAAARYLGVDSRTIARGVAGAARRGLETPRDDGLSSRVARAGPFARAVFAAWCLGMVLLMLVVLNVDLLLPDGATQVYRLVVGSILVSEGLCLLVRRLPFRAVLVARFSGSSARNVRRVHKAARAHLIGAVLTLLGFVWFAAGVLDLLRGIRAVV